jgi:hypothetical protein
MLIKRRKWNQIAPWNSMRKDKMTKFGLKPKDLFQIFQQDVEGC